MISKQNHLLENGMGRLSFLVAANGRARSSAVKILFSNHGQNLRVAQKD